MGRMRKDKKALTANLREAADNLDRHCSNVNKASFAGKATSVAGTVMVAAGALAAPLTGGVSMSVAAGTAAVLTGGAISAGSNIVGKIIEQKTLEEMRDQWTAFQETYKKKYKMPQTSITSKVPSAEEAAEQFMTEMKKKSECQSPKEMSVVAKFNPQLYLVVNIFTDITELIDVAVKLSYKSKSPAGELLRELANEIDKTCKRKRGFCCCC